MSWIAPRSNAWGRRCRIETTLDPASVRMRCVGSAERSTTVQSFLSAPATKTAKTGKPKKDETAGFGTGRKIVDVARTSASTLRKSELVDAARHLWINKISSPCIAEASTRRNRRVNEGSIRIRRLIPDDKRTGVT